MLSVKTKKGYIPLENRDNFTIVYSYEGEQTLSFDISCNDAFFSYLHVKGKLKYKDNRFNITKINKRRSIASFSAELDLNEWKRSIYQDFSKKDVLLSDVLHYIKPDNWTIEDVAASKIRCDIVLSGVSAYDILMACKKQYGVVFEYHVEEKRIKVIDPLVIQQRGLYLSEELNLDSVEYKGEYNVQVNRLYAYGKKTEVENEDGSKQTTYVNFAAINQGKEYVDCLDYIEDEIVCAYMQEDKCESASELLTLAKNQVKLLATPQQAWSCNVYDVSRSNEMYRCLNFHLYDKPVLLTDGKSIVHQIVEYSEYPDQQHLNKVVLSTTFKKIQGEITTIKSNMKDLQDDQNVKEQILNELKRDVSRNSLRIENTYSKNEIDTIEESIIEQTSKTIDLSIAEVNKKIEILDVDNIQVHLLKDGSILNHEITSIHLQANVIHNAQDITSTISAISFSWIRKSKDSVQDEIWNRSHKAMKEVILHSEDIVIAASFQVCVETSGYKKVSSFETITDETDYANLANSRLDISNASNIQVLNTDGTFYPDYSQTNVIITPDLTDGFLPVDMSKCEIIYKKIIDGNETELTSGETVKDGILTISKNVMSKIQTYAIYMAKVTYKNSKVKLFASFTLNIVGKDGPQGAQGTQGPKGDQGIQGPVGSNGQTSYFHIKYAPVQNPTSAQMTETTNVFIGTYVDYTVADSTEPNKYTWSRFQGLQGTQGIPGTDGTNGKTSYLHIKYSDDGGKTFTTNSGETTGDYIGTCTDFTLNDPTIVSAYTWVKVVGPQGPQGLPGSKGIDGKQLYTWLKYADSPTTGMSDDPTGKAYIGLAYNKITSTESSIYSDYSWSLVKGPQGEQGIKGANGTNGQPTYTWVKYGTSVSGAGLSDDPTGKTYIGLAYNKTTQTESTVAADYTWSLIKGDTGATGNGVSSITEEYYISSSKTSQTGGNWSLITPIWTTGKYVWTRSKIVYTNGTTTYTAPVCDSSWEAVNEIEIGGRNLLLNSGAVVINNSYLVKNYYLGDVKPKEGDEVTITIKGNLGAGKTQFGIYNSGGSVGLTFFTASEGNGGMFTRTLKWKITSGAYTATNTYISVYSLPSTITGVDSTIEWMRLDFGNKAPQIWSPAPEDIDKNINDSEIRITESYNSAIDLTKKQINLNVQELTETVSSTTEQVKGLQNQIVLTKEDTAFIKTTVDKLKSTVDGKIDESEIKEWARFNGSQLELGASNSPFKTILSTTELAFYQGTKKVAWISNNELHIANSVIMEILKVGNWICQDEGSAGLTWRRM